MTNPVFLVGAFGLALVLTLMGFMAPAAVLSDIIVVWGLSNAEAGWLGGALFMGYIATVCLLYTSPSPRDRTRSRMPSSA